MNVLFELYFWTLWAGVAVAGGLSIVGVHLASRDRAMQTVCVGQGATLGVILGLGIVHYFELADWMHEVLPFFAALLVSVLTFLWSDRWARWKTASKNTVFAFLFTLLMAMSYMVSALLPGLESHMSQVYFGDLSTILEIEAKVCFGATIPIIVFLAVGYREITDESFELSLFGERFLSLPRNVFTSGFRFVALLIICFSIQYLGYLYTMTCLFIPTGVISFSPSRGLKSHLVKCFLVAVMASFAGLWLSLTVSKIPTVPAVSLIAFGLALLWVGVDFLRWGRLR